MIGNLIRKDSSKSQSIKEDDTNYKELYLQCKKNVALFMKHVDSQLTSILKSHEQEKKKLKEEIQSLKNQLKLQMNDSSMVFNRISSVSNTNRRTISESKNNSQLSVSKETVEECLAKFNNFDTKTFCSEKRLDLESSFTEDRQMTSLKAREEDEKENKVLSNNYEAQLDIKDMKTLPLPRRDNRLRQKPVQAAQKVQNIKDFLKDIRGKFSKQKTNEPLKQRIQMQNIKQIISPSMFTNRNAIVK